MIFQQHCSIIKVIRAFYLLALNIKRMLFARYYILLFFAVTKEFIIIQVSLKILRIAAGIMLFNELGVIGLIYANIIVYATNLIILVILFRKIVFKINI